MTAQVNNLLMGIWGKSTSATRTQPDIIIGAGVGGLCAAIALAGRGRQVLVLERANTCGGKMRTLPTEVGPVDTGPTVLTLKDVFEGLFARAGGRLGDYVTLIPQPLLARHFWQDGAVLDLTCDPLANEAAIARFGGALAAAQFRRFDAASRALYAAFEGPMMRAAKPQLGRIAMAALKRPAIWPALMPHMSLQRWLGAQFSDPRLVQLFGRYATYVGGAPAQSPAVLSLIWQAEAAGVWAVQGGMGALAAGLERFAATLGVQIRCKCDVREILLQNGRAVGVVLADGTQIAARSVTFNGDVAALRAGLLGPNLRASIPGIAAAPRSLSAYVWAFAAQIGPDAPALAHHNVFFGQDPARDFGALAQGKMAMDPTLYVCAQDRSAGLRQTLHERFEIIMNAAPLRPNTPPLPDEAAQCQTRMLTQLSHFGLTFQPNPQPSALTTPQQWEALFPASGGAIYGRSPQSLLAPMLRPTAQTRIKGLYLAGGGAHPGAGVPMAALSGLHAAEAILSAPISP